MQADCLSETSDFESGRGWSWLAICSRSLNAVKGPNWCSDENLIANLRVSAWIWRISWSWVNRSADVDEWEPKSLSAISSAGISFILREQFRLIGDESGEFDGGS